MAEHTADYCRKRQRPEIFMPLPEKEVFDLIYEDLEYAITNLDWVSDEAGRFTQAAARHMKAKAALWLKRLGYDSGTSGRNREIRTF